MLSKFIANFYGPLLEVCIWLILVISFVGGWATRGFGAAIVSLIVAFVVSVVVFGAFLTLVEIRKSLKTLEERQTGTS